MSLSAAKKRSKDARQRSYEAEICNALTGTKMTEENKLPEANEAGLTETQQKLVDDFFIQTARKIVPITILGEKARVVFRHMFALVGDFHYGLDETGNVVVQDMRSGNFAILSGDILCSFVAAYLPELQSCKKDEVKQIVPDIVKEAGLVG